MLRRFIGFNRYMVECECGWVHGSDDVFFVLIDTWWNVNYRFTLLY